MFRSAATRSGTAGMRLFSTASGAPAGSPPGAVPPGSAPPPPPPPPAGPGFLRRATPLLLTAGTGYFFYKVVSDNEFRDTVQKAFPASEGLLNRIPSADPSPKGSVATDASAPIDGEKPVKSNLPPGYDTVPKLLQKIEESKTTLASMDSVESPTKAEPASALPPKAAAESHESEHMTPTERTASKTSVKTPLDSGGDGPMQKHKPVDMAPSTQVKKTSASIMSPASDNTASKESSLTEIMNADNDDVGSAASPIAAVSGGASSGGTSGKEKLARLLGKGDFNADKADGPDVVDDSVYRKPQPLKSSGRPERPKFGWKRGGPWKAPALKSGDGGSATSEDAVSGEVLALRSELESQMKWEAVRLQEALRAQMVEDRKSAAKEAATLAKKHAEELVRVRESAITKAETMLRDKSVELKNKANAERDADVLRLLKVKEEELRDEVAKEYAEKERTETLKREKAIIAAKAQVSALNEQFDAVVSQTQKAKEAAKRASSAFMLHESVSSSRPIGKQLSEASGKTELGQLVMESVPSSAVCGGVSSFDTLKEDFRHVSKRGLSVAMVPDGKAGTMWGHLLGAIFSRLKIPVDSRDDPDFVTAGTNEKRIRHAGALVSEGDLGGAIVVLESLNGLSAELMKDWLSAAKARVAADLAAEVLLADAIIAQVALTQGQDAVEQPVVC